jgi:hypothetical protein
VLRIIFDSTAITSTRRATMANPGQNTSQKRWKSYPYPLGQGPVRFVEDVIADQPELAQRLSSETTVIGHGPSSTPSMRRSSDDLRKKKGGKKK